MENRKRSPGEDCDRHCPSTPMACPECVEELLLNLLAVLHGDGGHHTAWVGVRQSVKDAEEAYYKRSDK